MIFFAYWTVPIFFGSLKYNRIFFQIQVKTRYMIYFSMSIEYLVWYSPYYLMWWIFCVIFRPIGNYCMYPIILNHAYVISHELLNFLGLNSYLEHPHQDMIFDRVTRQLWVQNCSLILNVNLSHPPSAHIFQCVNSSNDFEKQTYTFSSWDGREKGLYGRCCPCRNKKNVF